MSPGFAHPNQTLSTSVGSPSRHSFLTTQRPTFPLLENLRFLLCPCKRKARARNKRSDQSITHPVTRVLGSASFSKLSLRGPFTPLPGVTPAESGPHTPSHRAPLSFSTLFSSKILPRPRLLRASVRQPSPKHGRSSNSPPSPPPVCSAQRPALSGRGRDSYHTFNFEDVSHVS